MSGSINLLRKYASLDIADAFEGYAGVQIDAGTDSSGNPIAYTAGDTSGAAGRVLKFKNDFATQAMADNILRSLSGFQYQPYSAAKAILDPSVELGDGITANDVYGGIYIKATTFGKEMAADVSAPGDEEINHEYAYSSETARVYQKITRETTAKLQIQNQKISAKVAIADGTDSDSCAWELTTDNFIIKSKGAEVLRVDESGLTVTGTIKTGTHVGSTDGFVIGTNAIYKGISSMADQSKSGVYIGTDGIRIGSGFKVTGAGVLTASSGTFSGSVKINGSQTITIGETTYGSGGSATLGGFTSGISGGIGYTNATNQNSGSYPKYFKAQLLSANTFSGGTFSTNGCQWSGQYSIVNTSGGNAIYVPKISVNGKY